MSSSNYKGKNLKLFYFSSDLRIAFDLLDRNQDGRVTASELQFMLKNLGIEVRDELIDDLIKEATGHGGKDKTKFHNETQTILNWISCFFSVFVESHRQWTYG